MGVLSIQSHVSYGHVGNAAAVFILRRMGFDVWPVHTVMFSNHPGYGDFGGTVVDAGVVDDILKGLEARRLFPDCAAIVGGYLGSADTGHAMIECVTRVRSANPATLFYLDPVIGDRDSGIYVDDDIITFYQNFGLARADVIKSNAFELEVLSGFSVADVASAITAARTIIEKYNTRTVVVTSIPVDDGASLATAAVMTGGTWVVTTPSIPVEQKGAGDAFMALYVGNDLIDRNQSGIVIANAVSSIWGLTRETCEQGVDELMLIRAQHQMISPKVVFDAEWIAR